MQFLTNFLKLIWILDHLEDALEVVKLGGRRRHATANLVLEVDRISILVSAAPLVSELAQKLLQRQHVWIEKLFEVAA